MLHGEMSASALDASRDRVLKTAADGGIVLAHATAARHGGRLDAGPRRRGIPSVISRRPTRRPGAISFGSRSTIPAAR